MLMIHKAWGLVIGNEDDLRQAADLVGKIDGQIAASYASRAEGDADHFLELMRAETWFTPEEAVAEGLADEVKADNTQRPKAKWDLSAFTHAPELSEDEIKDVSPPQVTAPALAVAERGRAFAARLAANPI
jgi:hypothetical protein